MILRAHNIAFGPRGQALGRGIDFSLSAGELLNIRGKNGTGKSFLAKSLVGAAPPISGSVEIKSDGLRYLPQVQNRASHLPYTLGEVLYLGGSQPDLTGLIDPEKLGLGWNTSSGGERQRVLLARVFSLRGNLLVLDEPFNHLDEHAKIQVRARIAQELLQKRSAVVLISHDDNPAGWASGSPTQTIDLDNLRAGSA